MLASGVQGTVRYPTSMNCTSTNGPKGATPRALILKEHDQSMKRSALCQLSAQPSVSVAPRLSLWRRQRRILCKQPSSVQFCILADFCIPHVKNLPTEVP